MAEQPTQEKKNVDTNASAKNTNNSVPTFLAIVIIVCLIIGLWSCSTSGSNKNKTVQDNTFSITETQYAKEYDSDWPWSAEKVTLYCRPNNVKTINIDGTEYALNGLAKETGEYADLDEVWLPDPLDNDLKISTSDFMDWAEEKCSTVQ